MSFLHHENKQLQKKPIGIIDDIDVDLKNEKLSKGDFFIMTTDGITDVAPLVDSLPVAVTSGIRHPNDVLQEEVQRPHVRRHNALRIQRLAATSPVCPHHIHRHVGERQPVVGPCVRGPLPCPHAFRMEICHVGKRHHS